ncbi:helix-turn-helix transcriptional regulator [Rhodovibrionaceae bacterium A322]
MPHLSDDRRRAVAEFLKVRRDRLQPEDVGLPRGQRRRAPGLRREEVALLSGVSTEWYRWLEQARDIHPSRDALERIGGALRMEPSEFGHLCTLLGYPPVSPDPLQQEVVPPQIIKVLNELTSSPAYVMGRRWDLLAWNKAACLAFGDFELIPEEDRNCLYQVFMGGLNCINLENREEHLRIAISIFRNQHARFLEDPWFNSLIDRLLAESPDFKRMWHGQDVVSYEDGEKVYAHPTLGTLNFEFSAFEVLDQRYPGLRMIVYSPVANSGTAEKLTSGS